MEANWENLRFFLAVARSGSLTAAAKNLEVSQPTVGRRVRLATTDCLAYAWLVEETASLRERHSRIEFELIAGLGIVDLVRESVRYAGERRAIWAANTAAE